MRDRGDIPLWNRQDAINAWTPPMTGKRGAQTVYSNVAIATALTLRLLLRLPRRQTEGFLRAVLQRMGLPLPCPAHPTLSRRHATAEGRRQVGHAPQEPVGLIVDRSGLKVCRQGAWQTQKHGAKQGKRWQKLHLGVNDPGQIIASTGTESHAQDPSPGPALMSHVERDIARVIGDGMYAQAPVYAAGARHSPGARVIIPPRQDAVLSPTGTTSPTPRDPHLLAIESDGRFDWKRPLGYSDQADAEHGFSRCKRTCGDRLRAKREEAQEREASLACQLLNRMLELGRPQSYPIR